MELKPAETGCSSTVPIVGWHCRGVIEPSHKSVVRDSWNSPEDLIVQSKQQKERIRKCELPEMIPA
eukprot:1763643-Amphidinium_carterae.1